MRQQEDPHTNANVNANANANAKDLLARLRSAHPGRCSDAQLQTLQRRVKGWRSVMARRRVYGSYDECAVEQRNRGESALVVTGISS